MQKPEEVAVRTATRQTQGVKIFSVAVAGAVTESVTVTVAVWDRACEVGFVMLRGYRERARIGRMRAGRPRSQAGAETVAESVGIVACNGADYDFINPQILI